MTDPKLRTEPPPGQRCAGSAYRGGSRAGGGKRCCTPQVRDLCYKGRALTYKENCVFSDLRTPVARARETVMATRTGAAVTGIMAAR